MIPIGDDDSDRTRFPFINYALVLANIIVFVVYQKFGTDLHFTYSYATVPAEILSGQDIVTRDTIVHDPVTGTGVLLPGLGKSPMPVYLTLISSMFMHGGLAHIIGNMLYLLVFGDNIENRIGHIRYLFFYFICGIFASLTHVATDYFFGMNHLIPSLGASGAISGVLGAYLWLFPRRSVRVLLFPFVIALPALIVLGFWILFQLANGTGYLGGSEASGIAYGAHIGGFFAGMLLINFLNRRKK